MAISARVTSRVGAAIKKYQSVVADAKRRDISESDTVAIISAMLTDVFGYKKFEEVTAELPIKGAFCDLAVKVGGTIRFLIEAKAVNKELNDGHVRQAMGYGATEGIDWVVLTNAARWQAYKIVFDQPIDKILVLDVDISASKPKSAEIVEFFGNLSREQFTPTSMGQVLRAKQAMSKHSVAALLVSQPVLMMVRRELKRLVKGLNPGIDEIKTLVETEIIKRELIEGDEAKAALKSVRKASHAKHKKARAKGGKVGATTKDISAVPTPQK